jgi:peroxiredoxin
MAQTEVKKLDSGDLFPKMEFKLADGTALILPEKDGGTWCVLLVYRGSWWPVCHQQLADFQGHLNEFSEKGIKIIGASVDNLEDAQKMVERHKLTFPLAYGMDAKEFAGMTGAFYDDKKLFLHATGFIIRPDRIIEGAVYSTGPIGRLVAAGTLMLIDYCKKVASQSKS